MRDSSDPILYLSSFMRLFPGNSPNVSFHASIEPSSSSTLVSTSLHIPSTSHVYPTFENAYVNLVSHEETSGFSFPSCGLSSSSLPIFHSDEDIMEAMTTPNYPWDDMHHCAYFLPHQTHDQYVVESNEFIHDEVGCFNHPLLQTHEFKPHPPCGHYISTQCISKGASTFDSIGEEIPPTLLVDLVVSNLVSLFFPMQKNLYSPISLQITLGMIHLIIPSSYLNNPVP